MGDLPPGGLAFPDETVIAAQRSACFVHLTSYRYRLLGHDARLSYLRDTLHIPEADAQRRLDFS